MGAPQAHQTCTRVGAWGASGHAPPGVACPSLRRARAPTTHPVPAPWACPKLPAGIPPPPPSLLQKAEFGEETSIEASQEIDAKHDLVVYTLVSFTSITFSSICLCIEPLALLRGARARSAIISAVEGPGAM